MLTNQAPNDDEIRKSKIFFIIMFAVVGLFLIYKINSDDEYFSPPGNYEKQNSENQGSTNYSQTFAEFPNITQLNV